MNPGPRLPKRDIFRVLAVQVACPECSAKPRSWCSGRTTHKARVALARRVSGILVAHFDVKEFPCSGEAHKPEVGGMIDHCGVCMPRWGTVERLVPKEVVS